MSPATLRLAPRALALVASAALGCAEDPPADATLDATLARDAASPSEAPPMRDVPVPPDVTCGLIGLPCCEPDGAMRCMSGACSAGLCARPNGECGRLGLVCCNGSSCQLGLGCIAGRCVPDMSCGANGGPCCDGEVSCGMGLVCGAAGRCEARPDECGREGQPCCAPPTECARRFSCVSGTCVAI